MLFSLISSFLRGKEGGSLIFNLSLKIILPLYEVSRVYMSRYQRPTDKLAKAEEVCGQALSVLPHYFIKSLSIFAEIQEGNHALLHWIIARI